MIAILLTLPLLLGGWLILSGRLFAVTISGRSMEPSLRPGRRAFILRMRPRRGDIVLLSDPHVPGAYVIKRLAAVAGDPVPPSCASAVKAARVPDGRIILLGDNPGHSVDSRLRGTYPAGILIGVALCSRLPSAPPSTLDQAESRVT